MHRLSLWNADTVARRHVVIRVPLRIKAYHRGALHRVSSQPSCYRPPQGRQPSNRLYLGAYSSADIMPEPSQPGRPQVLLQEMALARGKPSPDSVREVGTVRCLVWFQCTGSCQASVTILLLSPMSGGVQSFRALSNHKAVVCRFGRRAGNLRRIPAGVKELRVLSHKHPTAYAYQQTGREIPCLAISK